MAELDHYFSILINKNGSDLHLEESQKAKIRVNGQLSEIDNQTLTRQNMINYISSVVPRNEWQEFEKKGDVDFAYALPNGIRFRGNLYRHVNGIGAIFRLIPSKIFTKEELNLPPCVLDFFKWKSGLVLVTGSTGSGKSTTLATIIDHINANFNYKIITIENPVEFVHHKKRSLITHREVGNDTSSFASALKSAIKSNVDIIYVGEMRDLETMELALEASEMGILVFSTLHTSSATKTVDRILDTFPNNRKNQIRTILANNLKAIVTQQLIPSIDLSRRYASFEVLLRSQGLAHIIHSGETYRLVSEIQTNRMMGMMLMDDSIFELYKAGKISKDQAYLRSLDKNKYI